MPPTDLAPAPRARDGALLLVFAASVAAAFVFGRIAGGAANRAVAPAPAVSVPGPTAAPDHFQTGPKTVDVGRLKAAVAALAGGLTSEARVVELLAKLQAWAALDPDAALEYVRQHLGRDSQEAAYRAILSSWAARDPHGAWRWASTHEAENALRIDPVLIEVGKDDPDLAWLFATEFGQQHPQAAKLGYSSALIGMTSKGNYAAATRLIQQARLPSAPDGVDGKYDLASVLAGQWARYEPEKAAAWAQTLPAKSIAHERALVDLSQSWAEIDPQRAVEYAVSLPPGPERGMVATQTLTSWMENDLGAAAAWINERPADPDFDNAVYQVATDPRLVAGAPQTALSWANSLVDPVRREWSTISILKSWRAQDSAAARLYVETSDEFAPELRSKLVAELNAGPAR